MLDEKKMGKCSCGHAKVDRPVGYPGGGGERRARTEKKGKEGNERIIRTRICRAAQVLRTAHLSDCSTHRSVRRGSEKCEQDCLATVLVVFKKCGSRRGVIAVPAATRRADR